MINLLNGVNPNTYQNNVNKIINNLEMKDSNSMKSEDSFKSIFEAASKALNEVNTLQNQSDAATLDFITGKNDNIHGVLLAQEKALIALQFTTEVTNKSLDAYNEIMRMQI